MNKEPALEDDLLFVIAVTFLLSCAGCFLFGHELAMADAGSEKRAIMSQDSEKLQNCNRVIANELYEKEK